MFRLLRKARGLVCTLNTIWGGTGVRVKLIYSILPNVDERKGASTIDVEAPFLIETISPLPYALPPQLQVHPWQSGQLQ